MTTTLSRRAFVGASVVGTAALAVRTVAADQRTAAGAGSKEEPFRLGMAGYTFRKFSLEDTLKMLQRVDVRYLCIKDFHLPLTAGEADIRAFHELCRKYGVTGYGVGPIYMGDEAAVDQAFEYAKRVGVKIIIGVPFETVEKRRVESARLLKYVERKVREYDVRYAIHNHGPDNLPYATADATMKWIADLDPRIGICLDIGHNLRGGVCPIEDLRRHHTRIYDLHLKNVTAADKSGKTVELGRGIIDIRELVRALREVNFAGVCSLEFEKDENDPLPGVAESVGYFRGVLDATRA
ncbi:MAG: sugar phosphate isomerase/epimerase [Kiritimatiellae bacterium]|nr:sugar phosphate isomerase/epimerase [Kiritimatiellia bacterium]